MIPYSRQLVTEQDVEAVVEVLRSDFLTQGPVVPAFERAVAAFCQAEAAVAANNATAALHLACLAQGIGPESLVWVAATSFVASANCARYCGAEVEFVDVEADTGLISLTALADKLRASARSPDLLIVVHLGGQSCDMAAIAELCRAQGIRVLEDACHALGGSYRQRPVGCCQYSDAAVFSFHPVKPITTAEGGMLISNDREFIERARLLANHGIVRNPDQFSAESSGGWYYEQQLLGYNYRLSDMQAALGLSQLQRLPAMVAERKQLAQSYQRRFHNTAVTPVAESELSLSALHLYPVLFPSEASRNQAYLALKAAGFGVNVHYLPIPSQPYYRQLGCDPNDFPGACHYAARSLSLPLFPGFAEAAIEQVVRLCLDAVG